MALSREEIKQIADSIAEELVITIRRYSQTYQEPKTIKMGLAESMGEELTASMWYQLRANKAKQGGDSKTADLYYHIMGKCVACMSKEAKSLLRAHFNDARLNETLDSIPDCKAKIILDFCPSRPGGKRSRSEYQEFVSKCMKRKNIRGFGNAGPALKECAAEWSGKT